MCTFLNASADINTQVEQSEQGTVSVETTFCNLNLSSYIYILCTILIQVRLLILAPKYSTRNRERRDHI